MTPEVFPDAPTLARQFADWLLALSVQTETRFAIALAGGETPRQLYALMASNVYRDRFPWSRMHWFLGDERFVPPSDPRSNYRMAHDSLLSKVPIPQANIHAVPTEHMTPEAAAQLYERTLAAFYGTPNLMPDRPLFDVVLLGLGEDGHTASLFPGSPVLEERKRWVAAVTGEKSEDRITLTYPVLESARQVAFLVAGAAKREPLRRFLSGDPALPASRLHPLGTCHVFADQAAIA